MVIRDKKKPTYNPDGRFPLGSTSRAVRKRIEEELGPAHNEGKPFAPEEDDRLLENYLVFELAMYTTGGVRRPCFYLRHYRHEQGIRGRLWKLAVGYHRPGSAGYQPREYHPHARTNRSGSALTKRDLALLNVSLGRQGRQNRAFERIHLILGRSRTDVVYWLESLKAAQMAGEFLTDAELDAKKENMEEVFARVVRRELKKMILGALEKL